MIKSTALISAALLYRSVRHRLPKIALVRMALNILINAVVGMVPFFGDIFVLLVQAEYSKLQDSATVCRTDERGDGKRLAVCIDPDRFDILPDRRRDSGFGLRDRQPISLVVNSRDGGRRSFTLERSARLTRSGQSYHMLVAGAAVERSDSACNFDL